MADNLLIFSGKQYSGKDTAAKFLIELMPSYKRCAMGDIIKLEYGKINNLTYEEIEANKSKYRQGLIDLGNLGRMQSPDFWLDKIVSQDGNIVVTDVRVKHEYEVFKRAGAIAIRIEADRDTREKRGGKLIGENDVTEVDLDNIQDWDYVVYNNNEPEALKESIQKIVSKLN